MTLKRLVHWLLLAAVAAGTDVTVSAQDSYLRPGTPEVGGVRHLVLIYSGAKSFPVWDAEKLLPYVTYVDRRGKPQDWFFDSFLWMQTTTPEGVSLYYPTKGIRPPVKADWDWALDNFSDPARGVVQLDACVRRAMRDLPDKNRRVSLVLTIPTAEVQSTDFGAIAPGGPSLDFRRDADRVAALQWYIREALARWKKLDAPHVRLAGFYWLRESIKPENRALVKQTAAFLHSRGMKLYWIPYLGASGIDVWRELGIDATMIQPNYAFARIEKDVSRLSRTARLALRVGAGLELEIDPLALREPESRARYLTYLDAGVKYGFMDRAILGYYEAAGLFGKFAASPDPAVRNLYDQTYRFVKGTYHPLGETPLPALDAPAPHRAGARKPGKPLVLSTWRAADFQWWTHWFGYIHHWPSGIQL
jgi:hypothetical protein